MPNTLLTPDMITREALRILMNKLVFTRNINRQYDDKFAIQGAKIGDSLRIRLPDRATVTTGPNLAVKPVNQQYTSLTVDTQMHVDMGFTTAEFTMKLDDFSKLYLEPRMAQLAASVDREVVRRMTTLVSQSVGTPGTTPGTSQVLLDGMQKLQEVAVPDGAIYATVNPAANAKLVEGLKGLFNPQGVISKQFKSGMMGTDVLGYNEINMSQSIGNFRTGTRTNGVVATTVNTQGAAAIALTIGANETINAGDVFTVDGVFTVNPQTRESVGSLFQFVALADATADGAGAVIVSVRPIYAGENEALATVDAFPQAAAAVVWMGGADTRYVQNLIYHTDAFTFATADLVLPKGVDMASRATAEGISLRLLRDYEIGTDRLVTRMDVLFGCQFLRPEMACRLWGAAA